MIYSDTEMHKWGSFQFLYWTHPPLGLFLMALSFLHAQAIPFFIHKIEKWASVCTALGVWSPTSYMTTNTAARGLPDTFTLGSKLWDWILDHMAEIIDLIL